MNDKKEAALGGIQELVKSLGRQKESWHGFFNHQGNLQGDRFHVNLLSYIKLAFFSFGLANGKDVSVEATSRHDVDTNAYNDMILQLKSLQFREIFQDKEWYGVVNSNLILSKDQAVVYLRHQIRQMDAVVLTVNTEEAVAINKILTTNNLKENSE